MTFGHFRKRCVPRAPIGSWSYDGTILATGYSGLHGINANWETPRVVARTSRYSDGRLSPNQQWYSAFQKYVVYAESYNHLHVIEAIKIFSTLGDDICSHNPMGKFLATNVGLSRNLLDEIMNKSCMNILMTLFMIWTKLGLSILWKQLQKNGKQRLTYSNGGSGFQREYVQFPSPDFSRTINYGYHADDNRPLLGSL